MRLIDANKLVGYIGKPICKDSYGEWEKGYFVAIRDVIECVESMSTIVVRCKDCWHKVKYEKSGHIYCIHHGMPKNADDYCSYGEREE